MTKRRSSLEDGKLEGLASSGFLTFPNVLLDQQTLLASSIYLTYFITSMSSPHPSPAYNVVRGQRSRTAISKLLNVTE